jgi:AcrR family transcriptional regulator
MRATKNKIHSRILFSLVGQETLKKTVRRRGNALEEAILEAAWVELLERGYAGFTMERVAERAGTSRPVLSRRWQTRADLAMAAIGAYIQGNHPTSVPDLGSVRDELAMFLHKMSGRGMIEAAKILFSMRDYFAETGSSLADLIHELRKTVAVHRTIDEILQRGIRRGEIDPSKLTKRIASLPLDLVRHEGFLTHKPIPRAVINEILDSIFLPLVIRKEGTGR